MFISIVITSKNNDNSENIDFDNLCSICYDSLDEETVVTLKCGHKYHYNCISMTYKSINKRFKTRKCSCNKSCWISAGE